MPPSKLISSIQLLLSLLKELELELLVVELEVTVMFKLELVIFELELEELPLQVMMYATELSSAFLQTLNDARQAFFRDFISSWVDLASQSSLNFLAATVMFAASAQQVQAAVPSVVSLRQAAFFVWIFV